MLNKEYKNRFIALGFKFIELYQDNIFQFEMLVTLPSVRHTILSMYSEMVGEKELIRLEDLDTPTKTELWTLCRPYTGTLTKEECIEFAKCYWALARVAEMTQQNENPLKTTK